MLGVSQAAASQQIKRLEEALGCRLFERRGRKLALAPAGERLLAQARRLLALNDEVWSAMRTPSFEGEVRLGVPYDIIGSFVPPILRRFAKAQPRVRVSLVCEDSAVVRNALRSGGVDLALTTETDCGRHGETLRTDRLVWVGVPGGEAHLRDPLPVSLGAPTCVFRPVAVEALGRCRRVSKSSKAKRRARRACPHCPSSASISMHRRDFHRPRAILPTMCARASRCGEFLMFFRTATSERSGRT
jgi:DNA-binding transcriptional LysR family regulator